MSATSGDETLPGAPSTSDTVLAPLFEGVKRHHWRHQMRINRASAMMLADAGPPDPARRRGAILAGARRHRARHRRPGARLHRRARGFLLPRRGRARAAARASRSPASCTPGRSRNDIDHTVFKLALKERLAALLGGPPRADRAPCSRSPSASRRHARRRLHPRPAGAADDLRPLSRRAHRAVCCATWSGCARRAATLDLSQHGRRGDHDLGLPARPRARWPSSWASPTCRRTPTAASPPTTTSPACTRRSSSCSSTSAGSSRTSTAWTGFEVGHLHVPDAFVQISSIMPQKRNPVPVEHLRLLCSLAAGRCEAVARPCSTTRRSPT